MSDQDLIRFSCPRCGKRLKAKPTAIGSVIRCPNPYCGATVTVPNPLIVGLPVPQPSGYTKHPMVLAPEPLPQPVTTVAPAEQKAQSSGFTTGMLIGVGIATITLFGICGICGLLGVVMLAGLNQSQPAPYANPNEHIGKTEGPEKRPQAPRRTGTITFAEYVDPQTFRTVNEGRIFSQGWVHLLVQSNLPFGDTRLVVTYRPVGTVTWTVLGEYAVDPNWNKFATTIHLTIPGGCRIKATTSRGEVIAEDQVQITGF